MQEAKQKRAELAAKRKEREEKFKQPGGQPATSSSSSTYAASGYSKTGHDQLKKPRIEGQVCAFASPATPYVGPATVSHTCGLGSVAAGERPTKASGDHHLDEQASHGHVLLLRQASPQGRDRQRHAHGQRGGRADRSQEGDGRTTPQDGAAEHHQLRSVTGRQTAGSLTPGRARIVWLTRYWCCCSSPVAKAATTGLAAAATTSKAEQKKAAGGADPEDNYPISDRDESSDEDYESDEASKDDKVPDWARGEALRKVGSGSQPQHGSSSGLLSAEVRADAI